MAMVIVIVIGSGPGGKRSRLATIYSFRFVRVIVRRMPRNGTCGPGVRTRRGRWKTRARRPIDALV